MLNQFKTKNLDWLLKAYGPKFAGKHLPSSREAPHEITGDFFKDVNTAALANLPAWVPALFPTAKYQPGTKAYRVSSADLGRDLEEDISLHPDGIRDFGEEIGLTPIDVAIEYGGAPTPQEAAFMLLRCLGISPDCMGWKAKATPQPKQDTRKWPEPLSADAFYGLAGEVVRAIAPQSEADEAALMIQFLVASGNIIGRSANYKVEGTRHYTNLFGVLVGDSSKSRKGTSWDRIAEMFEGISDDWLNNCTHGGMSSGEGLVYPVRDATTKTVIEKKTKELITEIDDPGSTEKRLLVQESEFAGALRVMRREGNTLSRVVRDAWDKPVLEFMTKNSRLRAKGALISIVGHITTDELKRELTATDMANGFANRFLFMCAKRSKVLPMGGTRSPEMIAAAGKVKSLVETRRNQQIFLFNGDADSASVNGELTWSADARDLWCEIYAELSAGKQGMFGSVTARAEAQVVRLSLIYAVLDNASAIEVVHLRAGLAVWRYSEASAEYIYGEAIGDSTADTVLQALRAAGAEGMARTQINKLFGGHKGAQDLARVLNFLLERKLARVETRATAGRSEEVWRAN